MKEIEFRSFDNKTNKFEYWSFPENKYDGIFWEMIKRPEFEKPQQSTGLKDKTGKLIFEGDILQPQWGDELPGQVIYYPNYAYFGFTSVTKILDFTETQGDEYEIIGDIYQNPELLKS